MYLFVYRRAQAILEKRDISNENREVVSAVSLMLHEAMVKLEHFFLWTTIKLERKVKEKLEDIYKIGFVFVSKIIGIIYT